jgi:flagellar hook-associated protein 2
MAITFGGLASGLNTNALIDGLMAIERIPLKRNQAKQLSLTSAKNTLASVLSAVSAIKTAAEALDTDAEFASFSTKVGKDANGEEPVVATVTGSALAGSYSVGVSQLAQETRTKSDSFADATAALGQGGDLEITVGGSTPVTVAILNTDTLTDIATKINASSARVRASVIYDGTNHRLLVLGRDTGNANQVKYAKSGTVALGLTTASNTYQKAQNSIITIDNQFTISRSTNKISDVIPGITITAVKITSTDTKLEVAPDADVQAAKINSFISSFNRAVSAAHLAAGYGSTNAVNRNLAGDSSIRRGLDRLGMTISSSIAGLTGKYNMLAAIGVNLSNGGTLELDKEKLQAALDEDPAAVARVFVGDSSASIDGMMKKISDVVDSVADDSDSVLNARKKAFESQIKRLADEELNIKRRLESYEQRLRKRFTALEIMISKIQAQSNGLAGLVNLTSSFTRSS